MRQTSPLLKQFQIELKLFFREPIYIFFVMLLPAISFVVFGSMYQHTMYGNMTFFEKYIPGYLAIIMYSSTIFGVGLQMVIDKESGVFKRLKATPAKMKHVLSVMAAKGFLVSLIGLSEILLLARFAFKTPLAPHWGEFLVSFMLSISTLLILGFLVSSTFNSTRSAIAALMVTFYPVFFLSDAAIPLKGLPKIFKDLAPIINPLYHVNVFLRECWMGNLLSDTAFRSALYLLAIATLALVVSARLYKKEAA